MNPHRGVSAPKSLTFLQEVLWEWIAIQERCVRLWEQERDALWWNNERTDVGGLAGAIWRTGGVVLEEFISEKRRKENPEEVKRSAAGRCDMYFELDGKGFVVEAKKCWPWFHSTASEIVVKLDQAEADVRRVKGPRRYRRLAVVIAAPKSAAKSGASRGSYLDSRIPEWISQTAHEFQQCAIAWVFPQACHRFKWKRKCYPGVAIIVKMVGAG